MPQLNSCRAACGLQGLFSLVRQEDAMEGSTSQMSSTLCFISPCIYVHLMLLFVFCMDNLLHAGVVHSRFASPAALVS